MASPSIKEWYVVYKSKYKSQVVQNIFTITILLYNYKVIEKK